FSEAEKAFLTRIAPTLADAARRALLVGEASEPDHPEAPGVLIVDAHGEVHSRTPGVNRWLAEIAAGPADRLPSPVLAVAGRALRAAESGEPDAIATARV